MDLRSLRRKLEIEREQNIELFYQNTKTTIGTNKRLFLKIAKFQMFFSLVVLILVLPFVFRSDLISNMLSLSLGFLLIAGVIFLILVIYISLTFSFFTHYCSRLAINSHVADISIFDLFSMWKTNAVNLFKLNLYVLFNLIRVFLITFFVAATLMVFAFVVIFGLTGRVNPILFFIFLSDYNPPVAYQFVRVVIIALSIITAFVATLLYSIKISFVDYLFFDKLVTDVNQLDLKQILKEAEELFNLIGFRLFYLYNFGFSSLRFNPKFFSLSFNEFVLLRGFISSTAHFNLMFFLKAQLENLNNVLVSSKPKK